MSKTMLLTKTFFKHNGNGEKTSLERSIEVEVVREYLGHNDLLMAEVLIPSPVGFVKRRIQRSKLKEKE